LAQLLTTSHYATNLLEREPQNIQMLKTNLQPLTTKALTKKMLTSTKHHNNPKNTIQTMHAIQHRKLLQIATNNLLNLIDITNVNTNLSQLTNTTLKTTLTITNHVVHTQHGHNTTPTQITLVAINQYNNFELSYNNDTNIMFVHNPLPNVEPQKTTTYTQNITNKLQQLLTIPKPNPTLEVDTKLQPKNKQNPLVHTLNTYTTYYTK